MRKRFFGIVVIGVLAWGVSECAEDVSVEDYSGRPGDFDNEVAELCPEGTSLSFDELQEGDLVGDQYEDRGVKFRSRHGSVAALDGAGTPPCEGPLCLEVMHDPMQLDYVQLVFLGAVRGVALYVLDVNHGQFVYVDVHDVCGSLIGHFQVNRAGDCTHVAVLSSVDIGSVTITANTVGDGFGIDTLDMFRLPSAPAVMILEEREPGIVVLKVSTPAPIIGFESALRIASDCGSVVFKGALPGSAVTAVNHAPEFWTVRIFENGRAIEIAWIPSFTGIQPIPAGGCLELAEIHICGHVPAGCAASIVFADDVGEDGYSPAVVTFEDGRTAPALTSDLILVAGARTCFMRGDANGDGDFNIGDPIAVILYLFAHGSLPCLDAADVNDDGTIDIADAIYALSHQFAGGPKPPPPFVPPPWDAESSAAWSTDPTPDPLDCATYPAP